MKILVTGAAGFIGSHLCERLIERGHQVTGIDNFDLFYAKELKQKNLAHLLTQPSFRFIHGDLANAETLSVVGDIEVVVHLAAKAGVQPSLKNPQQYIDVNIKLTNTLLEWMRERGIRKFVFGSSSSVYGNTSEVPFKEDQHVDSPISPYAFTKRSCELMNYTYHNLYNIDVINLRFFTVYGERQRPDLAIHKFVRSLFNNEPIYFYGSGDTARDYTYCGDTVKGIIGAINYITKNENVWDVFNLGNSTPVSLSSLISSISVAAGKEPQIIYTHKMAGDVDVTYADISHAQKILGYAPGTGLEEGLSRFVAWYKSEVLGMSI